MAGVILPSGAGPTIPLACYVHAYMALTYLSSLHLSFAYQAMLMEEIIFSEGCPTTFMMVHRRRNFFDWMQDPSQHGTNASLPVLMYVLIV